MTETKGGFFYGWWIVVATLIIMVVNTGFAIYGFSLFVLPLVSTFNVLRSQVMIGMTLFTLITAFTAPYIGSLIQNKGPRWVLLVGSVVAAIGFILCGLTQSIWMFYISMLILACGVEACGPITCNTLVAYWFNKKRGIATGISTAGIGIGGFIAAPLISVFLIPTFGWRLSYISLAIITFVVTFLIAFFVIKERPEDLGLFPDGEKSLTSSGDSPQNELKGMDRKSALKTSAFWCIAIGIFLFSITQFGMLQNQVLYLNDVGFDMAKAASVTSIVAIVGVITKLIVGYLLDIFDVKKISVITFLFQAIGIAVILCIKQPSQYTLVYVYGLLFGIGTASWATVAPMVVGRTFGLRNFAAIWAAAYLLKTLGDTIGPILTSTFYDITGTYIYAFIILAIFGVLSSILYGSVKTPKQMLQNETEETSV